MSERGLFARSQIVSASARAVFGIHVVGQRAFCGNVIMTRGDDIADVIIIVHSCLSLIVSVIVSCHSCVELGVIVHSCI
jgi:hypothetical protein